MFEGKAFLEEIHIKNFLSLRDVIFSFKPLTVLVGPNASGKSNTIAALDHLQNMITSENLPFYGLTKDSFWAGEHEKFSFDLQTKVKEYQTLYYLEIKAEPDFTHHSEQLTVNGVNVISIQDGKGVIRNENGENETKHNSNRLALMSTEDDGHKPITQALLEFIKNWKFYNFDTDFMRQDIDMYFPHSESEFQDSPKLTDLGENFVDVLWNWYNNSADSFRYVNESLSGSIDHKIGWRMVDKRNELCLLEKSNNPISLKGASDGILRLIAYNILLNEPDLPPLIAIEEPERNLHPGAQTEIAYVLEQISKRSQVIITTHSSQLLGAFDAESLGDSLGVLLLQNHPGSGTEVLNLEDYRDERESLQGWIDDFGIGSAVFDSKLLQDVMEDKF